MDINAIKTFLEVAKTRHFGHAANALFVSQSTVSARIRSLEESIGAELFIRERGNIRLSPTGEALMTYAQGITTLWARAQQEIASPQGARETIAFGGLSGLWDITLQNWLHQISESHPSLAISADIFSAETLVDRLTKGALDIAFLYDAPQSVNLTAKQLKPIKLLMVSSEPMQELSENWHEHFIRVDWGMNFAVQFAAEFPDIKSSRMMTGLGRIAQEQLKRVNGFAYLAEPAVRADLDAGELYTVPNMPVFKRKAYAIFNHDSAKSALVQELLEAL